MRILDTRLIDCSAMQSVQLMCVVLHLSNISVGL